MVWPFSSTVANTSVPMVCVDEPGSTTEQFQLRDDESNTSDYQSTFQQTVPEKPHTLRSFDSIYGRSKSGTLLTLAARREMFEILDLLITEESIHDTDRNGNTLLHIAAFQGNTELCEKLLNLGASLNVDNKIGITPIRKAIDGKHPETALFLVKYELARRQVTPFQKQPRSVSPVRVPPLLPLRSVALQPSGNPLCQNPDCGCRKYKYTDTDTDFSE